MPYQINPTHIHTKTLIDNIEDYFEESTTVLYDKRNVIRVVNFEGEEYVVKAFKVPNLVNRLVYRYFRPSKAKPNMATPPIAKAASSQHCSKYLMTSVFLILVLYTILMVL